MIRRRASPGSDSAAATAIATAAAAAAAAVATIAATTTTTKTIAATKTTTTAAAAAAAVAGRRSSEASDPDPPVRRRCGPRVPCCCDRPSSREQRRPRPCCLPSRPREASAARRAGRWRRRRDTCPTAKGSGRRWARVPASPAPVYPPPMVPCSSRPRCCPGPAEAPAFSSNSGTAGRSTLYSSSSPGAVAATTTQAGCPSPR